MTLPRQRCGSFRELTQVPVDAKAHDIDRLLVRQTASITLLLYVLELLIKVHRPILTLGKCHADGRSHLSGYLFISILLSIAYQARLSSRQSAAASN